MTDRVAFPMTEATAAAVISRLPDAFKGPSGGLTFFVGADQTALYAPIALQAQIEALLAGDIDALALQSAKDYAANGVVAAIDRAAQTITAGYPQFEIASWGAKAAFARAVIAGDPEAELAPLLVSEATGRGVTVAALAAMIVDRADVFETAIGELAAIRATAQDAIAAATDQAMIDAVLTTMGSAIAALVAASV